MRDERREELTKWRRGGEGEEQMCSAKEPRRDMGKPVITERRLGEVNHCTRETGRRSDDRKLGSPAKSDFRRARERGGAVPQPLERREERES